jgi:hypothetical protein
VRPFLMHFCFTFACFVTFAAGLRSLLSSHIWREGGLCSWLRKFFFFFLLCVCILLFLGGLFKRYLTQKKNICTRVLYFIWTPGLWYVLDVSSLPNGIAVRSHYETFDGPE